MPFDLLLSSNLMLARGQDSSIVNVQLWKERRIIGLRGWTEISARRSSGMRVIQILVADNFLPWQDFVRRMLESDTDLKIIGTATDGLEAVSQSDTVSAPRSFNGHQPS